MDVLFAVKNIPTAIQPCHIPYKSIVPTAKAESLLKRKAAMEKYFTVAPVILTVKTLYGPHLTSTLAQPEPTVLTRLAREILVSAFHARQVTTALRQLPPQSQLL